MRDSSADELGAHVSAAGGVERAPGRAGTLGTAVLQLFTKQPSRWAEPTVSGERARDFEAARTRHRIVTAGSHDSYLINLASPEPPLWRRSLECFRGELVRATALGLDFVVTHPGNATGGDPAGGLARNAEAVARALEAVPGDVSVLLELTAGSGTSVGATFENLATIIDGVPPALRARLGVCLDTCHAFAAGYDLRDDYEGVWARFDEVLGLERLGLLHLNDSKHALGSRRDRHEHLGEGGLGVEPFRRIMTDPRLAAVPKVLETPKGEDPLAADGRNLALLRRLRREG